MYRFHDDEEATPENIQQTQPPYFQYSTTQSPYLYTTTQPPHTPSYYTTQTPYKPPPTSTYYTTTTTRPTTKFSYLNFFSVSTTKSPYDFKNFGRAFQQPTTTQRPTYTTKSPYTFSYTTKNPYGDNVSTTKNPYIGDYYILRSKTTKSPYDFGDFGRTTKNYHDNINNNYLKRSYNSASYFQASSNRQNVNASPLATFRRV